jgi:hypothetical protein
MVDNLHLLIVEKGQNNLYLFTKIIYKVYELISAASFNSLVTEHQQWHPLTILHINKNIYYICIHIYTKANIYTFGLNEL